MGWRGREEARKKGRGALGVQTRPTSRGCVLGRVANFKPQTRSYFLGARQALSAGLVTPPKPPDRHPKARVWRLLTHTEVP